MDREKLERKVACECKSLGVDHQDIPDIIQGVHLIRLEKEARGAAEQFVRFTVIDCLRYSSGRKDSSFYDTRLRMANSTDTDFARLGHSYSESNDLIDAKMLLESLNENDRKLLYEYYFLGYTHKELCKIYNVNIEEMRKMLIDARNVDTGSESI